MANYWPNRALPSAGWEKGFWEPLVDDFAAAYNFTADFSKILKTHGIARLVARIPFLAGCSNPKRLATEHLGTFLLWGMLKKYFYYQPSENLRGRIAGIGAFPDGDADVLSVATDILELLSLFDHVQDQAADRAADKFNPITSGDVEPDIRGDVLLSRIQAASKAVTDEMFATLGPGLAPKPGETAAALLKRWGGLPDCRYWWWGRPALPGITQHRPGPIL